MTDTVETARNHRDLGLRDEDVLAMYRAMVTARLLDDRMWALNRQGKVPFVASCSGHEGAQVGAAFAFDPGRDWFLPYYRDVAFALSVGITQEQVLLGVFGKAADRGSGGRQMPNHWSDPDLHVFTQSSPIGTQYPHACGIAYELQRQGSDGVVYASGGEGSTSEGDWHEALNFAAIHGLPVVFFVENNMYSISVPEAQQVGGSVAGRAAGYGIPGVAVDGNDVLAVYGAVKDAVDRARDGGGPTLIEARTYRYYAHTSDDDDRLYRSPDEVEAWRRRDPIEGLKQYLVEHRLLGADAEAAVVEEAKAHLAAAVEAAEAAADPTDPVAHVYARPIEPGEASGEVEPVPEGEEINLITAVNRALHEVMAAYPEAVAFGEDVADPKGGVFKATLGLTEAFGADRSFNTPLAEALVVGLGVGMAGAGGRPIAEIQFADFIHPAFDQIVSEAARIHYRSGGRWLCPLVIRVPYGGGVHGALYHSQSIEAFYAHVPGLKVVVPSTPADLKGMLWEAVEDPDPVMFLEPKKLYRLATGPYPEGEHRVPLGRAALRKAGEDLTIIAYGAMAHFAVAAAEALADRGVDAGVLDLRSLRPLDWPAIAREVERNGKVLIVHEDNVFGGFGAEVSAQIMEHAFDWLDAPVQRYGPPEIPAFPFATSLEAATLPSVAGIVERAERLAAY